MLMRPQASACTVPGWTNNTFHFLFILLFKTCFSWLHFTASCITQAYFNISITRVAAEHSTVFFSGPMQTIWHTECNCERKARNRELSVGLFIFAKLWNKGTYSSLCYLTSSQLIIFQFIISWQSQTFVMIAAGGGKSSWTGLRNARDVHLFTSLTSHI